MRSAAARRAILLCVAFIAVGAVTKIALSRKSDGAKDTSHAGDADLSKPDDDFQEPPQMDEAIARRETADAAVDEQQPEKKRLDPRAVKRLPFHMAAQREFITSQSTSRPFSEQPQMAIDGTFVAELPPFKGLRLVHLDLKGAPPTVAYLLEFFELIKKLGATGVLLEYEDVFPFTGELEILTAKNAYSVDDVRAIVRGAQEQGLQVVPLMQSFGHLEFVLKHKKFKGLRERSTEPMAVCASSLPARQLIIQLITQVLTLHPNTRWIHLGGDEVYNLASCELCRPKGHEGAFLGHMIPILEKVKSLGPQPIIWDDMLRKWNVDSMRKLSGLVEPMVWGYKDDLGGLFPDGLFDRYAEVFPRVWAASAFKGATTPGEVFTPVVYHASNHLSWLSIAAQYPLVGIALTGWSRYDHYAGMCELLPQGIPSLATCLSVLQQGRLDYDSHIETASTLAFPKSRTPGFGLTHSFTLTFPIAIPLKHEGCTRGRFPGSDAYQATCELASSQLRAVRAINELAAWTTPYLSGKKRLNPWRVSLHIKKVEALVGEMAELRGKLLASLGQILMGDAPEEYVADKVDRYVTELKAAAELGRKILARANELDADTAGDGGR